MRVATRVDDSAGVEGEQTQSALPLASGHVAGGPKEEVVINDIVTDGVLTTHSRTPAPESAKSKR